MTHDGSGGVSGASTLQVQQLTRDETRQRIVQLLSELTAHLDRGFGPPIGRETKLVADLEFDSVDIVQFALAVEDLFKRRKLPFEKLLMTEGRYRDDVTVGEVEDFLADCLHVRQ